MSNDISSTEKLTILLVENSRTARAAMSQLLNKLPVEPVAVASGPEALDYLNHKAVDLIIMDIYMPLMNGYEVAQTIRMSDKNFSHTPIVAYTASKNPKDKTQCLNAGINEVLIKSEDNRALLDWLNNFIVKHQGQPPSSEQ